MKILKSLFNILVLVIIIVIIGIIFLASQNSGGRNLPDYSETQAFKLEKLDSSHSFLYQCAKNVTDYSFFSQDGFITNKPQSNLILVVNNKLDNLYLYTPTYSGKANLHINNKEELNYEYHEGKLINKIIGTEGYQYNVRIPYVPAYGDKGFYYLTINDNVKGNLHNYNFYFQPIFIAGPVHKKPNFENYEDGGHITITAVGPTTFASHLENVSEYYPLEIEDEIWSNSNKISIDEDAETILVQVIVNKINTTVSELRKYKGEKLASEITSLCLEAAQELNDDDLTKAVQNAGIQTVSS